MKLLITGANGQVGYELCRQAADLDVEAICLDRQQLDITDNNNVRHAIASYKPDRIINAAAYTAVDKAESEEVLAYRINRDAVEVLADCCKEYDIPLLHISSDYVFSGDKSEPYIETDKTDPVSIYGKSKSEGDRVLANTWHKHIILRASWVFGQHGNNFVKTMIKLGSERKELGIVNDQYGAPTPADCIAETLLAMAMHNKLGESELPWGIWHLGSEPGVTWYQFAKTIFEELARHGVEAIPDLHPISTDEYPVAASRPANSKLASHAKWPDTINSVCDWKKSMKKMISGILTE